MPITANMKEALAAARAAETALRQFWVEVEGWRFRLEAPQEARLPGYDDSTWQAMAVGEPWYHEYTHGWYRLRLVVPESVRGIPTRGQRLVLALGVDDRGEIYLDGELQQAFEWDDGRVVVSEAAEPGQEYLVAVKAINDSDEGKLRFARLWVAGMHDLEQERDRFLDLLRRAVQFCGHAQGPAQAWAEALMGASQAASEAADNLPRLPELAAEGVRRLQPLLAAMQREPVFLAPPYLQYLTTNAVSIRWETAGELPARVEVRQHLYGTARSYDLPADTLQRVRIEHLQPGTAYMYRVAVAGREGEWHTFRTAPERAEAVRFVVWGDSQSHPEISEQVVRHMARFRPDLALSVGDIVGHGGNLHEWVDHHLWPLRELACEVPTYVAIGNHDCGGFHHLVPYQVPPFARYFEHPPSPGSPYWYAVDWGPARFLVLDAHQAQGPRGERIPPGGEQYRWLEAQLAEAAGGKRWIFVFVHEPPYSECWSGGYYDGEPHLREELVPLFERYGVDIVFSGHTHDYERGLPHPPYDGPEGKGNTVTYIITGGGGGRLDDHKYREWPQIDLPPHPADPTSDAGDEGQYYRYHFCLVEADGDRLTLTAHAVEHDGRYAGVLDQFSLQARKR